MYTSPYFHLSSVDLLLTQSKAAVIINIPEHSKGVQHISYCLFIVSLSGSVKTVYMSLTL
jgi:hypothetical protein